MALKYDETVAYRDIQLRWLALEDSRCPIGVTCVWAGQTVVTLAVTRDDASPLELSLLTRAMRPPEASSAFGYELRLLGVDPHPREGVTPARGDYTARLEISSP